MPDRLPVLEQLAVAQLASVRHAVEEHDVARLAVEEELAHHRHERRVARARRDEDVGPLVVGLEHELALRPDHPHPMPDRQVPQDRREGAALDEAHIELIAGLAGDARRRCDRIRPLHDLAVDEDPDRHVLPGFEGGRLAIEADPEAGQAVDPVLAPDQGGVVALVVGVDDPAAGDGSDGGVGHESSASAEGCATDGSGWRVERRRASVTRTSRRTMTDPVAVRATGPGEARDAKGGCGQPPLSPWPRQDTVGFQSANAPIGFDL